MLAVTFAMQRAQKLVATCNPNGSLAFYVYILLSRQPVPCGDNVYFVSNAICLTTIICATCLRRDDVHIVYTGRGCLSNDRFGFKQSLANYNDITRFFLFYYIAARRHRRIFLFLRLATGGKGGCGAAMTVDAGDVMHLTARHRRWGNVKKPLHFGRAF